MHEAAVQEAAVQEAAVQEAAVQEELCSAGGADKEMDLRRTEIVLGGTEKKGNAAHNDSPQNTL